MCLLHCNKAADESLQEIRKSGDKNAEGRLAGYAADDTKEQANGLATLMHTVSAWAKIPELSPIKKYRSGRHRYYILGRHTDCQYHLRFILVNKKDADDTPHSQRFQSRVLKAIADQDVVRTLLPPQMENTEE